MDFRSYIEQIPNITIAKRVAAAYVADYRRLDIDEIKQFLEKTAPQYIDAQNIAKSLDELKLDSNRSVRIIAPILLRNYLLDQDDFISTQKNSDAAVLAYEQSIVDQSNNFDFAKISRDVALFKHMLDTAWAYNDDVSVDEKNLIEALRKYLNISTVEQHILEAKAGRFPEEGNSLHTLDDIDNARKALQSKGLLMCIKDSDGNMCDIIPSDIADGIRTYYGIEIRSYGYEKLVDYVIKKTKKNYLLGIVSRASEHKSIATIELSANPTVAELRDVIIKSISPSNLLGGFSPRDGLDVTALSAWCAELGLPTAGAKAVLISRVLNYYDEMRRIEVKTEDSREALLACYHQLACRDLKYLRSNNIIDKDLQCERLFEDATDYLFEKLLLNKPLTLMGTEHPDGKLSFKDKYIMWDNKSKETPVNLKDHIQQFDGYIRTSDKDVAVFMVIAPEFTEKSVQECVDYMLNNDTQILLITADELKEVAEQWSKKHPGEIFTLGYFKQNGRFDINLVKI